MDALPERSSIPSLTNPTREDCFVCSRIALRRPAEPARPGHQEELRDPREVPDPGAVGRLQRQQCPYCAGGRRRTWEQPLARPSRRLCWAAPEESPPAFCRLACCAWRCSSTSSLPPLSGSSAGVDLRPAGVPDSSNTDLLDTRPQRTLIMNRNCRNISAILSPCTAEASRALRLNRSTAQLFGTPAAPGGSCGACMGSLKPAAVVLPMGELGCRSPVCPTG